MIETMKHKYFPLRDNEMVRGVRASCKANKVIIMISEYKIENECMS